ncbi:hypothetical protein PJIAN_3240 [Paludibacter jiangxiensis]|uniref:Uncharacterized protein n=1 Tax=Paludibacter jiangxiensis TaxID=681398 RepID=A0A170ZR03_9BACT|nr:hypothetical protein PJIAN_3240 [Paludibacter jiangxiensis]
MTIREINKENLSFIITTNILDNSNAYCKKRTINQTNHLLSSDRGEPHPNPLQSP